MDGLIFGDVGQVDDGESVIVNIPEKLDRVEDLFAVFKEQLGLPEYFGKNWDALSESLRDLTWVPKRTVVLVHRGRTFPDDKLWAVYLDVLKECIEDWRKNEEHRIVAVFPESCRDELGMLTTAATNDVSEGDG